jgi:micrococcal nuclease
MAPGARPLPGDFGDLTLARRESRSDGLGCQFFRQFLWSALALCIHFATITEPARADVCRQRATILRAGGADEVVLDHPIEGTSIVRLAGIDLPELPNSAKSRGVPDEVEATLLRLVEGRAICLLAPDRRQDRYGRLLAQVYRDDGLWVQGELLRLGLVRVLVTADARALASDMLAIEDDARRNRRGLWSNPRLRVRTVRELGRDLGSFQLVQGRVLDAERRGDRWYLNFGDDWRSDFTVMIPTHALPDFAKAKLDPYALKGGLIRVRGWVENLNGPMIEVVIPEHIEVLDGLGQ